MAGSVDYAFPAGDESDNSNDEWEIEYVEEKSSCVKDLDAVAPHADNDVALLKKAIDKGDIGTVEQLLDNGMNVETSLGFGWTPLMCAVTVANYDLATCLLERGASANISKDCWTVLMASCTASASEDKIARCVALLLSRNADPNMVDRSEMTCLMLAARNGYSKVINLLVSHGAEINVQDHNGYTALSIAVQFGREEAVLKLLQLGADKTVMTNDGKSPLDLATIYKRTKIARILASSSRICSMDAVASMDDTFSNFFKTNSEPPSSKENDAKLDDLELFLHGLDLGCLTDITTENDITWSSLLTMEKEDMEKIGIKDPVDQHKVLSAVQQMHLDKVDLDTISQLGIVDCRSEELQTFLISIRQQCCYLTQMIQDVISRFPRQVSQLVFSLDPNKDAQTVCNQLVMQTNDLQKEVICLRNLLCQMDEAGDCSLLPQPRSHTNPRVWHLKTVALGALGATFLFLLYKAACRKGYLQV